MPSKKQYLFNNLQNTLTDLSNKYDALLLRIETVEELLLDLEGKL